MSATTRTTLARRVSFLGALTSEAIKFRGLLSNSLIVAFTFAILVANSILMPWAYVFRERESAQAQFAPFPEMIIDKTAYVGIILAVLAALFITNEYRSGQIKTTLLSVPRRTLVILAKGGVLALVAFAVGVVSASIGYLIAPLILADGGYAYDLSASDAIRLIAGSGLYLAVLSIIGLALGTLIRNVVASVLSVLILTVILPVVPQIFSPDGATITDFFPIQAGGRLLSPAVVGELDPWIGFGVLSIWAVASVGGALVLFRRRDA